MAAFKLVFVNTGLENSYGFIAFGLLVSGISLVDGRFSIVWYYHVCWIEQRVLALTSRALLNREQLLMRRCEVVSET